MKNYGDYYSVGLAAPFQITPSSKLTIGWAYVKGDNNFLKYGTDAKFANSGAVARGVVTVLYAITF